MQTERSWIALAAAPWSPASDREGRGTVRAVVVTGPRGSFGIARSDGRPVGAMLASAGSTRGRARGRPGAAHRFQEATGDRLRYDPLGGPAQAHLAPTDATEAIRRRVAHRDAAGRCPATTGSRGPGGRFFGRGSFRSARYRVLGLERRAPRCMGCATRRPAATRVAGRRRGALCQPRRQCGCRCLRGSRSLRPVRTASAPSWEPVSWMSAQIYAYLGTAGAVAGPLAAPRTGIDSGPWS